MIVTETFEMNGKTYVRTYSDSGFKIHGGFPEGDYDEVVDPETLSRTYTETNIPIEGQETLSMEDIKKEIITETVSALL